MAKNVELDPMEIADKNNILENEFQEYLTDNFYENLHRKIVEYLVSGKMHSTLVGVIINLDGNNSTNDQIEAKRFADYIVGFLQRVN